MFEEQLTVQPPLLVRWFTPGEPVILGRWILLRALGAYAPTAMRAPDGRIAFGAEP